MATKHPRGLYTLFFIEMWERFGFYIIGGILLLYATDYETEGLGLPRGHANEIVGTYLAFVYFTPFLGGLLADRVLGYRWSVLIGGLIMAAGHFLLGTRGEMTFTLGLTCVCIGNGLFKPNISVMVGNLYPAGDPRRDAGFNIFYMGINIGAFLAFYWAGIARNSWGWSAAFISAGIGLLLGVVILMFNWRKLATADRRPERHASDISISQIFGKILLPAFAVGLIGWYVASKWFPDSPVSPQMCGFLAGMVPIIVFFVMLGVRATPEEKPGLLALMPVFLAGGTFFMILHLNTTALTQWANDDTNRHAWTPVDAVGLIPMVKTRLDAPPSYFRNAEADVPRPDPRTLAVVPDDLAKRFGTNGMDEGSVRAVLEAQPELSLVVTDGSVGGTAEVEAAPEPVKSRAVNVYPDGAVTRSTVSDHGREVVNFKVADGTRHVGRVAFVRPLGEQTVPVALVDQGTFDDVYRQAGPSRLAPGEHLQVTNPEYFQSANAICVILFTPLVVWFFAMMRRRGREIGTAHKILYGILLTMAAMLLMAVAGWLTDGNAYKVSAWWLLTGYAILTLGELCLSPMGLSLVTKLSPKRLVGLMMGGWFCASAFGNKLSGFFGGIQGLMSPSVFFLVLAGCVGLVALFLWLLLPKLDAAIRKYGA